MTRRIVAALLSVCLVTGSAFAKLTTQPAAVPVPAPKAAPTTNPKASTADMPSTQPYRGNPIAPFGVPGNAARRTDTKAVKASDKFPTPGELLAKQKAQRAQSIAACQHWRK